MILYFENHEKTVTTMASSMDTSSGAISRENTHCGEFL